MIVKNEELVLSRCLECVRQFADEIIIVDTGSTDRTKEIALKYADKVADLSSDIQDELDRPREELILDIVAHMKKSLAHKIEENLKQGKKLKNQQVNC